FVFFFQAEVGIRVFHVTGVQTCALPILPQYTPECRGVKHATTARDQVWSSAQPFSNLARHSDRPKNNQCMFFEQERGHFFRPLTGKYRAQVMECLRELYQRLYSSSSADYGQALARDTMLEIFQEALVRAP